MLYILKDGGRIVGWGETEFVTGAGQTQETFEGTMEAYAHRFHLEADKTTIEADGVDQAIITLTSNVGISPIDVDVNGVTVSVTLTDGVGTLPPITSLTPGVIVVKTTDETLYSAAGEGLVMVEAV